LVRKKHKEEPKPAAAEQPHAEVAAEEANGHKEEVANGKRKAEEPAEAEAETEQEGWGSGYPSDARCVAWLRRNMHPVFGWGPECRFSWGTAKDMLEAKGAGVKVEWPADDDGESSRMTDFFGGSGGVQQMDGDELG